MHEILLYYKYTHIAEPEDLRRQQRELCERLNCLGRIIIATEGINGTIEGLVENTTEYIRIMRSDPRFSNINFKRSNGTGSSFPRLSIKVRSEIVGSHLGEHDLNPNEITGQYITAEELHGWIHNENRSAGRSEGRSEVEPQDKNISEEKNINNSEAKGKNKKEFYIIDMRNEYEHKIGFFKDSLRPSLKNFRDLPALLPTLEHLKNKIVVTVCTGGVRCEKASGLLLKNGFQKVYQLSGGIVTYMEKYPEEDFQGKLYVFDGRITMGFNNPIVPHTIVGRCDKCQTPSENYVNCSLKSCNAHFICCEHCQESNGQVFCGEQCRIAWNFSRPSSLPTNHKLGQESQDLTR